MPRIMGELLDESLDLIHHRDPDDVVESMHETRKNCKKGRGLVRLVRPALGDEYTEANRSLRDAARALAPIRDPHATLRTFDDLIASAPGQVPDSGVLGVREELADRSATATRAFLTSSEATLDRVKMKLESVRDRAGLWDLGDEFEPVASGITKTYRRGRNRLSDVLEAPLDTNFHEWRKRVKYLWYHVRLLRPAAPSLLRPLARRLHDLSDALGDAHDLSILRGHLAAWECDDLEEEIDAVDILARGRKGNLQDRATSLGLRIYVEKPDAFADRMAGYWGSWHRAAPRKAGELEDLFPPQDQLADHSVEKLRELAKDADLDGRTSMSRDELERSLRAAGF